MTDDFGAIAELGGAAAIEIAASALAEHGATASKCRNCGAPVIGAYCISKAADMQLVLKLAYKEERGAPLAGSARSRITAATIQT